MIIVQARLKIGVTYSWMVLRQEQAKGAGSREQVQSHFSSETGEQGVRLGAESTGAFGLRLRRESFHLRISMQ